MAFDLSTLMHKNPEGGQHTIVMSHENIEQEVLHKSAQVPVVVLIGSSRSDASEQLRTNLDSLAAQAHDSWVFAYLDADSYADIAQMFGVRAVPTVVALFQARPVASFEGNQKLEDLQRWTTALVAKTVGGADENQQAQPVEDPRFEPALEALNRGDYDAAIAVYDSILAQEPGNKEAQMAKNNALFLSRLAHQKYEDPVAVLQENPDDIEALFAVADQFIAHGHAEQAFDILLDKVKDPKVKEHLLSLFSLFDSTDPRVMAARQKMASALF